LLLKYAYQLVCPLMIRIGLHFSQSFTMILPMRFQFMLRGCNIRPLQVGWVQSLNDVIYLLIIWFVLSSRNVTFYHALFWLSSNCMSLNQSKGYACFFVIIVIGYVWISIVGEMEWHGMFSGQNSFHRQFI
jgi:hypothetical protein